MNRKHDTALTFQRRYTKEGINPFNMFEYELRDSNIQNTKGHKLSSQDQIYEVPKHWSKNATDILISKFFRKDGVPLPDGSKGQETSIKQTVHRLANCWRVWGEKYGYFYSSQDAQIFYEETVYCILNQACVPNSPQWFNTGLYESYGIKGAAQGHYYVDPTTKTLEKSKNAYEHPQPHACFILSVDDDLVNPGGIMDLWTREAMIFKYGSGVGTNFSNIRGAGEHLSGGGTSSGLLSFLKIGDRAAGAIKSGGTTRRAAKMVCLDIDHPEIEEFISWKANEEIKVAALVNAGYSSHYEGEAYNTVSGQNSNNSIRLSSKFIQAVNNDEDWNLIARSNGKIMKTLKAKYLWDKITDSAWRCADPGVQFDDTINEWHTCPKGGRIKASNPCSEYMFLDNTACNLASINLMRFFNPETKTYDMNGFTYTCRLWTVILEISVLMAQFPSKEVAQLSFEYRTLGLGYANLGTLLMTNGLPYDSEKGRNLAAVLTAIMTGVAYFTSAEMAKCFGPFERFKENEADMLRVIRNHRYAVYNQTDRYEELFIKPQGIQSNMCPENLLKIAQKIWDDVVELGSTYGFRNAQATVIAPTGTIGFVMDCDTTGIEPEFALVKSKKLAGGGEMKIINQSVPMTLKILGYTPKQIQDIIIYIEGHKSIENSPYINGKILLEKGVTEEDVLNLTKACKSAFHISHIFNNTHLSYDTYKNLNLTKEHYKDKTFNVLDVLDFTDDDIEKANEFIFGNLTIEGAPHFKTEHLPIFDCANKCGIKGKRFIHYNGHIDLLAACQPFISGAISKTINMPEHASVNEVSTSYFRSWEKGLKSNALYRENCKQSQPLNTKVDTTKSTKSTTQNEEPNSVNLPGNVVDLSKISTESLLEEINNRLFESSDTKLKHQLASIIQRKPLPARRKGYTYKIKILGEQVVFLRTGEYGDGTLGEIFIDLAKQGSAIAGLTHCFAIAVSIGLQYGVPLEEFVNKFVHIQFEPKGFTDHPTIKNVSSIADLVFKILGVDYLGRHELAHVAPKIEPEQDDKNKKSSSFVTKNTPSEIPTTPEHFQENQDLQNYPNRNDNIVPKALSTKHSENNYKTNVTKQPITIGGTGPSCTNCGFTTTRNGTCFVCSNCGTTTGCS